ncbi:hypothetical protein M5K25_008565 [Dendrobium thyrsiflorum]|uniref:Uncharacterized protein n=1 Tax=Dendrobium thyrsiflorum TaxID=117978 RepID=A0ABD0VA42_DENTH
MAGYVIYTAGRDTEMQKAIIADTSPFFSRPIIVVFVYLFAVTGRPFSVTSAAISIYRRGS